MSHPDDAHDVTPEADSGAAEAALLAEDALDSVAGGNRPPFGTGSGMSDPPLIVD